MKAWTWGWLALLLTACASAGAGSPPRTEAGGPAASEPTPPPPLDDLGPAPEFGNEVWLNTEAALRLSDLKGRVVLLDMWTFGCVNCRNVIPSLRTWHERYAAQGLIVIGNHYPEFAYERDLDNLRRALVQLDVPYAVAQDNDGRTWRAYNTHYWPTLYLIDKQGHVRYRHIGEGRYAEIEAAIVALLGEPAP